MIYKITLIKITYPNFDLAGLKDLTGLKITYPNSYLAGLKVFTGLKFLIGA